MTVRSKILIWIKLTSSEDGSRSECSSEFVVRYRSERVCCPRFVDLEDSPWETPGDRVLWARKVETRYKKLRWGSRYGVKSDRWGVKVTGRGWWGERAKVSAEAEGTRCRYAVSIMYLGWYRAIIERRPTGRGSKWIPRRSNAGCNFVERNMWSTN